MSRISENNEVELAFLPLDQLRANEAQIRQIDVADVDAAKAADEGLLRSIRENGILQPLLVAPAAESEEAGESEFVIVAGHRRARCAEQAGLTHVPAYIRYDLRGRADEVVKMLVENMQRRSLTTAEQVSAAEQLSAFDLAEWEITQATGLDAEIVHQALTVANAPKARAVGEHYNLSLFHAAAMAEFEDDPEALKILAATAVKEPQRFDHILENAREEATWRRTRDAKQEELERAGVRVLAGPIGYTDSPRRLDLLQLPERPNVPISEEEHSSCPGHAASIRRSYEPGEDAAVVQFYCEDWKAYGHEPLQYGGTTSELDEKRREATAKANEERAASQAAWKAATVVRCRFIAEVCQGKKIPPFVNEIIGSTLLEALTAQPERFASVSIGAMLLGEASDWEAAGTMADGADGAEDEWWISRFEDAPVSRRALVAFAGVASAIENDIESLPLWRARDAAKWLQALQSGGYVCSEVEADVVKQGGSQTNE